MIRTRRLGALALVVLFIVSFFLRAYHPISRPAQWLSRSQNFVAAIEDRDWVDTYQQYHPGVTTMAISGATLWLYDQAAGTPAAALFEWGAFPYATEYGMNMAVGVLGLAFVLALLTVAIALALRRLAGWTVSLTAGGLLAISPLILAQGQVLHVDALLGSLMLLSALLLLIYVETGRRINFVLSGLAGGLAFLTKSPAIFMIPYTGLVLLVAASMQAAEAWGEPTGRAGRVARVYWRGLVLPFGVWLVLAALPFALWPAMWVEPKWVLSQIVSHAEEHTGLAHPLPRFFAGNILRALWHPGLGFYPVSLALNTTFVTLTMLLYAVGHVAVWPRLVKHRMKRVYVWLLIAFAAFFVVQMTISAKHDERYITPAHFSIEVLAAVGVVGLADLLASAFEDWSDRLREALPGLMGASAIVLTAAVTLPFAPNYGAHHNYLFAGNRFAVRMIQLGVENEGVNYFGEYLERYEDPENRPTIAVAEGGQSLEVSLGQYAYGKLETTMGDPQVDYWAFFVQSFQRRFSPAQWKPFWEQAQTLEPAVLVTYDGVDYAWLYSTRGAPDDPLIIRRGWMGWMAVAWLWTLGLGAATVVALRRTVARQPARDPLLTPTGRGVLIGVLVCTLALTIVRFTYPGGFFGWFFALNNELSAGTLLASALQVSAAVMAGITAWSVRMDRRRALGWSLLVVGLVYAAVDEFFALYNLLPGGALLLVALAVVAVLGVGLLALWPRDGKPDRAMGPLASGLATLVVGGVWFEYLAAYLGRTDANTLLARDLSVVSQAIECIGLAVLVAAFVSFCQRTYAGRLRHDAPRAAALIAGLWSVGLLLVLWALPTIAANTRAEQVHIDYQDGAFSLVGYKLSNDMLRPGESVTATLYWRLNQRIPAYTVSVHWLELPEFDSVAQADPMLAGNLGGAEIPGYGWLPGTVMRQRVTLDLPADLDTPRSYELMTRVWDKEEEDVVTITGGDLEPFTPNSVLLTTASAVEAAPAPAPEVAQPYRFGDNIALLGYDGPTSAAPGDTLTLDFWWQPDAPISAELNQFVHLYDAQGEFVFGYDQPPFEGRYPTTGWVPGALVQDTWQVQLPDDLPVGTYTIRTGLYEWPSLVRLPAQTGQGEPVPDDSAPLYEITIEAR